MERPIRSCMGRFSLAAVGGEMSFLMSDRERELLETASNLSDQDMRTAVLAACKKTRHTRAVQEALDRLPDDMVLTPAIYHKIAPSHNRKIIHEFMQCVAPAFLSYLAQYYSDDLRKAGFCAHALARMANGQEPFDKEGRKYHFDIDHMQERAGGGAMSHARLPDSDLLRQDIGAGVTYTVNHFSNLYFLPCDIHAMKNTILAPQIAKIAIGEQRLVFVPLPRDGGKKPVMIPKQRHQPTFEAREKSLPFSAMSLGVRASFICQRIVNEMPLPRRASLPTDVLLRLPPNMTDQRYASDTFTYTLDEFRGIWNEFVARVRQEMDGADKPVNKDYGKIYDHCFAEAEAMINAMPEGEISEPIHELSWNVRTAFLDVSLHKADIREDDFARTLYRNKERRERFEQALYTLLSRWDNTLAWAENTEGVAEMLQENEDSILARLESVEELVSRYDEDSLYLDARKVLEGITARFDDVLTQKIEKREALSGRLPKKIFQV